MTLIHVPRPPQHVANPDRPISSLLRTQVQHLHEAEKNLPLRYRSERYIHAIKTEGEAAAYIRDITEGIIQAHQDAAKRRATQAEPRQTVAGAAEPTVARTSKSRVPPRSATGKPGKKK